MQAESAPGTPSLPEPPHSYFEAEPILGKELGVVFRLYRAQPAETRRVHHPFPFDRLRLSGLLAGIWLTTRLAPRLSRRLPRLAAAMFGVRAAPGGPVVGFGTIRFRRDPSGRLVARTGIFVEAAHRRHGLGRRLKEELSRRALTMGAQRMEALLLPSNTASVELNRRLGFRLRPTRIRDRHPPHEQFLIAELDLPPLEPSASGLRSSRAESSTGAAAD